MTLEARMAIEALRAGVPNRAAIRQMGTEQTGIEHAFEAALAACWADAAPARAGAGSAGIGMAGGFGTGKSHLLGYLAEVASHQRFVVSRIVVSKETPLSHSGHVLAAALRDAALPDRPDDPIAACVTTLREQPEALDAMDAAIGMADSGFAPTFAACLYLVRRASTPPETLRQIARLWSGAKVSASVIRQALRESGSGRMFALKAIPAAVMTDQLARFVPLLFRAAGYAGWCVLLDEIELIGRYTPLQRALAYAWLGAWLGLDGKRRFPGIVTAYAITDDFAAAVIQSAPRERQGAGAADAEGPCGRGRVGAVGDPAYRAHGAAESLLPPTLNDLAVCHDKVQRLYSAAYDWPAPQLPPVERASTRTMRQYIKGWITLWDLRRLGSGDARLVTDNIASNYAEDATLAEPRAPDAEEA